MMNLFAQLKELKLLLIDDDEWIRDSMRLFFESEGCNLVALETAEEALEMVRKQSFDIIISDFRLPGMDGIELFKRTQNSCRSTLKILITAYMNEKVVSAAKKAGIDDMIEKPFKTETIEKSLYKLLNRNSSKEVKHVG